MRKVIAAAAVFGFIVGIGCATTKAQAQRVTEAPSDCRFIENIEVNYVEPQSVPTFGRVDETANQARSQAEAEVMEKAAARGATHVFIPKADATTGFHAAAGSSSSVKGAAYKCPAAPVAK